MLVKDCTFEHPVSQNIMQVFQLWRQVEIGKQGLLSHTLELCSFYGDLILGKECISLPTMNPKDLYDSVHCFNSWISRDSAIPICVLGSKSTYMFWLLWSQSVTWIWTLQYLWDLVLAPVGTRPYGPAYQEPARILPICCQSCCSGLHFRSWNTTVTWLQHHSTMVPILWQQPCQLAPAPIHHDDRGKSMSLGT